MKKYFTSLVIENDQFVAIVYDANTNQELYKSKPYNTQTKAMQDVNNFLAGQKTIISNQSAQLPISQTTINTITPIPTQGGAPRRCCGR